MNYLYHLTAEAVGMPAIDVGACADSHAEARSLVRSSLSARGYVRPSIVTCYRVPGPHVWEHGTVLVYSDTSK